MVRACMLGLAMAIVAAAGCTGKAPAKPKGVEVRGKVVLAGGAPLSGGMLVLRPVDGIHGATAQIQKDGAFSLVDPAGAPSVVPGRYQVYVVFNGAGQNALRRLVNERYQNTEDGDSDVVVDIADGAPDLIIKLGA